MSVSEKLQQIAENEQRVYDAGYQKGKAEGGDTEQAYEQGVEAGKQAEYDRFWNTYQNNGNRDHYVYAFSWIGWNDDCYNPKYPIIGGATKFGLQQVFVQNNLITDTKVDLIDQKGNIQELVAHCTQLVKIPLLQLEAPVTNTKNAFVRCAKLTDITIKCVGDGCIATSISFAESPLLTTGAEGETTNSVQSIIDALMTITDGVARTLTLHADVRAKLTSEQVNTIKNVKGWSLIPE